MHNRGVNHTVTGSTGLAIPLSDIKDHLNIDYDFDDARIENLILAATEFVEDECSCRLTEQTFQYTLRHFPVWYPWGWPVYSWQNNVWPYNWTQYYNHDSRLELPVAPLQSVTQVEYYDPNTNTLTTWSSTNYQVVMPQRTNGWVIPVAGVSWPETWLRDDAVQITYTAGYTTLPNCGKQLLRILTANWNENREALKEDIGIDRLLGKLKTGGYY